MKPKHLERAKELELQVSEDQEGVTFSYMLEGHRWESRLDWDEAIKGHLFAAERHREAVKCKTTGKLHRQHMRHNPHTRCDELRCLDCHELLQPKWFPAPSAQAERIYSYEESR